MIFLSHYFNFMMFNTLQYKVDSISNRKMANNFTSLVHATGSTLLAGRYLLDKTKYNYGCLTSYSSAYFIYDLLYLCRYWEPKPLNYAYIYHHFSALYIMYQDPVLFKGGHILFLGELSNLPSYFVYYYQKQPNKANVVKKLKYLQFFLYTFIRVPLLSCIVKDLYMSSIKTGNYLPFIVGSPVFLMGLFWSKKLFDKL